MKYVTAVRLMTPRAKSSKYVPMTIACSARSSPGATAPAAGPMTIRAPQNSAPRMNPIVALRVSRDASIPTAISAAPMNQYPT